MAIKRRDFLIVIPARLGSKGVPGKNFKKIGGKTLVQRSIQHALLLGDIADILVSTDSLSFISEKISETRTISKNSISPDSFIEADGVIYHFRDSQLSQDESLIMDLINHICVNSKLAKLRNYRSIVLLQPTTPFRTIDEIGKIRYFLTSQATENSSLVSFKSAINSHPARMYAETDLGLFRGIESYRDFREARRQDCPPLFLRDGGYYVIGTDLIREKRQSSEVVTGMKREFPLSINIDTEEDFMIAEMCIDKVIGDPNGMLEV